MDKTLSNVYVDREIKAFFLLLPFSYVLQVLFFNKHAVLILYLPLLIALCRLAVPCFRELSPRRHLPPSVLMGLVLLFMLMPVYASLVELFFTGPKGALKILLTQLLPVSLFFMLRERVRESTLSFIVGAVVISASVISVNEIYEFAKNTPTAYEARNYEYVKASAMERSGVYDDASLGRWSGTTLRPGGLMDHVHASPFFIGFGLVGSFAYFLHSGTRLALFPGMLCLLGLVASGMRLPVFATGLFLFLVTMFQFRTIVRTDWARRRGAVFLFLAVLAISTMYLATIEREDFWALYLHPLKTGEVIPGGDFVDDIVRPQIGDFLSTLKGKMVPVLIGYGLSSSWAIQERMVSDEIFVLNVLGGGGLLGITVFYGLFVAAAYNFVNFMRRTQFGSRAFLTFASGVLFILFISTLHSGIFMRRTIYPVFFFSLAAAARLSTRKDTLP